MCINNLVAWAKLLDKEPSLLKMSSVPEANNASIRSHEHFGKMFGATPIPDHIEGFQCKDAAKMAEVWPEGTKVAKEVRFISLIKRSMF